MEKIVVGDILKFEGMSKDVIISSKIFEPPQYLHIEELHMVDPSLGFGICVHNQKIYIPTAEITDINITDTEAIAHSDRMIIAIKNRTI